jgi:capsid protein
MSMERQFSKAGGDRSLYRACLLSGMRVRHPLSVNPWAEDRVVDLLLRAAQSPTSMADSLPLLAATAEFVQALTPFSAAADLFTRSTNLTFGRSGILVVPSISDLPMADWIAEGAPIPVVMGVSTLAEMLPYKIATMVALTSEMLASWSAETVIRQALVANVGPSLDRSLFSDAPGVLGLRPSGLLNGIAITPPSAHASPSEAMIEDVEDLVAALAPYGGNGRIVIIAPPKQSVRLMKFILGERGYPVLVANQPNLIAVATNALAVAVETPEIEASSEAIFHVNDAPLPIVDDTGIVASPVRSAWQTDSIGLRFILPVSWSLLAPAVAWTTPTAW